MVETFWSADTPSRTRLRRKKKIVHTFPPPLRQPALCSASPDSLHCAGQPVMFPQPVHQRCVPSLMVVKMMTRKLFHLPQQYSLFVVVVTSDEHVIVVFIVVLSLESIQLQISYKEIGLLYPRQCFFVFALCCMLLFVLVDCCYCILVFPDQPTRLRRSVRRLLRIKWQPPTLVTTQQRPDMSDCAQT